MNGITGADMADLRNAAARAVACCPTCQVEPGTECHLDGRPLPQGDVHPARLAEAEVTT